MEWTVPRAVEGGEPAGGEELDVARVAVGELQGVVARRDEVSLLLGVGHHEVDELTAAGQGRYHSNSLTIHGCYIKPAAVAGIEAGSVWVFTLAAAAAAAECTRPFGFKGASRNNPND